MKDYKKKYEEANKIVATRFGSDVAREIFKDLYENEDDKIRKGIIDYISNIKSLSMSDLMKKRFDCWIAWLEKQGEQKETLCEKCRREQIYHSCQDITELGRCALEYQNKK